ncbi:T9SS type A sorting domain-containing protein [Winogradskyella vidalii]|uniref:T9SS type A sorting domain-containing protein n=1 Tax=Winogradskyella vidalii TaxID=2615024 RepID=UPI0015CE95E7|nr:T9SS type A sorting domain-containing protein [Winogradskyella vidalii]
MKTTFLNITFTFFSFSLLFSQTILSADGPGNTYEDITSVLAPGYNAVEVPDCSHTDFGRHIDEVFDTELDTNVFRFIAHQTPDNDRCQNFDRQRVEIKTYASSPDHLKATEGETVAYTWKFKLPNDFQVSSSFTHIHQIKAVGGPYESIPMITLTLRKSSPDRIELRYTATNNQNTIETANLDLLRGHWVQVTETITFGNEGSYSIDINQVSNGASILSYSNDTMDTWQDGANFARPKWGIYRSLNQINDLQDEIVRFADFSIEEFGPLTVEDLETKAEAITLVPNPAKHTVTFKNAKADDYDAIILYNSSGETIPTDNQLKRYRLDVSDLSTGLYYIAFIKSKRTVKVLKCLVK